MSEELHLLSYDFYWENADINRVDDIKSYDIKKIRQKT